jgi:hypothetical protein
MCRPSGLDPVDDDFGVELDEAASTTMVQEAPRGVKQRSRAGQRVILLLLALLAGLGTTLLWSLRFGAPPPVTGEQPKADGTPDQHQLEAPAPESPNRASDPPAPVPRPPTGGARPAADPDAWLAPESQAKVDRSLQRGVQFLKTTQSMRGSWAPGTVHHVGMAALPALTLLECGLARDSPVIRKAQRHVRAALPKLQSTYELATAILLLDRLDRPRDQSDLRTLALRLVAGQRADGGWSYQCPILGPEKEASLLTSLQHASPRSRSDLGEGSDLSNTQFSILALCAAQRHGLSLERPLALVAQRLRRIQEPAGGWSYRLGPRAGRPTPSMTCAGLLGLAVGRALPGAEAQPPDRIDDVFGFLGRFIGNPLGSGQGIGREGSAIHLYFLWSLERTAVLYNRRRIDGKDWYRWGAHLLLAAQGEDGSWDVGGYPGATALSDTCFALLFLRRANLANDQMRKLEFLIIRKESP